MAPLFTINLPSKFDAKKISIRQKNLVFKSIENLCKVYYNAINLG